MLPKLVGERADTDGGKVDDAPDHTATRAPFVPTFVRDDGSSPREYTVAVTRLDAAEAGI